VLAFILPLLPQPFGTTEVESNDLECIRLRIAGRVHRLCGLGDPGQQVNPGEAGIAFGIIAACVGLYILLGWF
jgi:hypothetical protein